ncbi:MAG: hypothetical protein FWG39_00800 [Alphaproteobacteria bacterium]|nr:hypothetical protein [Alphaproteobacteria bacterium]
MNLLAVLSANPYHEPRARTTKHQLDMNIDYTASLKEISAAADVWCGADASAGALAAAADVAMRARALLIAVAPPHVHIMWSWLEGKDTEVFAVFQDQETKDFDAGRLAADIHAAFKKGAAGAIIPGRPDIILAILPVRQDLFFGKKLFISADLKSVGQRDWAHVFNDLKRLDADGILLDARLLPGKNGRVRGMDAVGKIYGFLENLDKGFTGTVSVLAGNPGIMESVFRLAHKMRPDITKNLRFFIGHGCA